MMMAAWRNDMKGDIIFPKNCIRCMPWWWKMLARFLERRLMSYGTNRIKFSAINIELMARDRISGRFISTPWFMDETLGDK